MLWNISDGGPSCYASAGSR